MKKLHQNLLSRLDRLNATGVALSAEKNIDRLLELILDAAKSFTHADSGTFYRVIENDRLKFEILRNDTLNISMGGCSGVPIPFEPLSLYDEQGRPNDSMVVVCSVLREETINIEDAYSAEGFDFSGTRRFDAKTGYRSKSFLTIPMKNHEGEIIGVLQLINAKIGKTSEIIAFSKADQSIAESLASQAAIALSNRQLINQMENMFDAMVKMISIGIDEKSQHTAGHCGRVPEITMLLAEAAHECMEGPLKDFRLTDEDRYELRIAALLHDCGKITTPVHVVDKATKLQTLFDRIELIDTRFEVLKRDAEINRLKSLLDGMDADDAMSVYSRRIAQLDDDKTFLHNCNIGGEFMTQAHQARIDEIACYVWQDETGVRGFLSDDEAENLKIAKGTLNDEERKIINYHIVATIKMLKTLPWPKHLKRVPEYAGGHHERMDGQGYPNGLKGDQMPVQARIMAIADIFEALTASDRPYRRANTLSEALKILSFMKKDRQIDPELFDIFIKQKIYLQYAQQFLNPNQIDEVDELEILA